MANKFEIISIFALSLIVQGIVLGKYLDNSIINPYLPFYTDAKAYVEISNVWSTKGFDNAFENLSRMPGYPAFLHVIRFLSPNEPFLTVRIIQLLTTSFSIIVLYFILKNYSTKKQSFIFCIFYCFVPIWHFNLGLTPESLTYFLIVLLIYFLNKLSSHNYRLVLIIGLILSSLIYLKPNHILLIFPVFIFLLLRLKKPIKKMIISLSLIVLFCLLPWVIFANNGDRKFYGLTTTQGINLYIGTGMVLSYDGSVLARSAISWRVDPRSNPNDIEDKRVFESEIQSSYYLTGKSLEIWTKRPLQQLGYAFDKILIAFGLKVNSIPNYLLGVFTLLTLASSISIYWVKRLSAWGATTMAIIAVLAFQAAIFQADRRFVLVILLPFGCVIFMMAYSKSVMKNKIMNLAHFLAFRAK